jgi:hypothetical protein
MIHGITAPHVATVAVDPWRGVRQRAGCPLGMPGRWWTLPRILLANTVVDQVRRRTQQATPRIGAAAAIRCIALASCG